MQSKIQERVHKVYKHFSMIFVMGCVYLLWELVSRYLSGSMIGFSVGNMVHSKASLTGWTSFWMLPVGGLCGYLLGWMNEWKWSKRLPLLVQGVIGVVLFIWPIELVSGIILNNVFDWSFMLGIWDYSHDWANLLGQITLTSFPGFMFVSIFAFWFDDILRHWHLGEIRPDPLHTYYWRAIRLKR